MKATRPDSAYAAFPDSEPTHVVIKSAEVTHEEIPERYRRPGGPTEADRICVVMEAVDGEAAGAQVRLYGAFSLNPKSNLRKLALAAASRDLSDDELFNWFDTDTLPGRQLTVIATYQNDDGTPREYPRASIFKRLPKSKWIKDGAPAATAEDAPPVATASVAASTAPADDEGDLLDDI